MYDFSADQTDWIREQIASLSVELQTLRPSEWAEQKRYLPPSVGPMPGFFRFDVTPYMREIVDCLAPESPVREVALMKGVQIAYTTAVLENALGYLIDHIGTAPAMLVTADDSMAKTRMESFVVPMLQSSGLMHLITSGDETNKRKTGRTDRKVEWRGGGFLLPIGAQSPNKFRSIPTPWLLADEIDAWPLVVGKDGDPVKLVIDRTAAYESTRKLLFGSTPTVLGLSKIHQRYLRGDQRKYFVRCLKCGFAQTLRWSRQDKDTGVTISGIVWETEHGRLVPESVRYLCESCQHPHTNDDKTRLLSPDHGAEWRPTAEPVSQFVRSYHLPALYSPVGMQTWAACVHSWMDAWDDERHQPKDPQKLQVFYNNVLGEPFRQLGHKIRYEIVSTHRRNSYRFGEIPNKWAAEHCGSPVLLLTCAVDVNGDNLAVAVFGWCRDRRNVLIDYWRFDGNVEQSDHPATWGRLQELIETQRYVADDGKTYAIALTLVDSGFLTDQVYQFASQYERGVFPIKGRDMPPKSSALKEFSEFTTPMGQAGYLITVDLYKDRQSSALRRSWDGHGLQPYGHFNAPIDVTDEQLKELTVETRRERIEQTTQRSLGFYWHRPQHSRNELWDLLVYNDAAVDLIAWNIFRGQLDRESVNWTEFWDLLAEQKHFFQVE